VGCLGFVPPLGKITPRKKLVSLPHNSEFIKLAILQKKRPIGAAQAIISIMYKKEIFFNLEKKRQAKITPIIPPWNDMPPSLIPINIYLGLFK
jgi:hypothetical protein